MQLFKWHSDTNRRVMVRGLVAAKHKNTELGRLGHLHTTPRDNPLY